MRISSKLEDICFTDTNIEMNNTPGASALLFRFISSENNYYTELVIKKEKKKILQ